MTRLAKVVLPGYPYHITLLGNRRQCVFFTDSDYVYYLELLVEWRAYEGIEIWAYCLMTNHVHLIVKPKKKSNLGKALVKSIVDIPGRSIYGKIGKATFGRDGFLHTR